MTNEKEMSFEEINAQIESIDLSEYEEGGKNYVAVADVRADASGVLSKICGLYKKIRPILVGISKFPLLPASWKGAIKTFIGLMDTLCP